MRVCVCATDTLLSGFSSAILSLSFLISSGYLLHTHTPWIFEYVPIYSNFESDANRFRADDGRWHIPQPNTLKYLSNVHTHTHTYTRTTRIWRVKWLCNMCAQYCKWKAINNIIYVINHQSHCHQNCVHSHSIQRISWIFMVWNDER